MKPMKNVPKLLDPTGLEAGRVPNDPILQQPLLTNDEAAALLSLGATTLKKWRRIGCGPRYYRLGSAIRYSREDLETWVSRSAANPPDGRHDENSES